MAPRAQARILCVGLLGALLAQAPAAAEPTTHVYRVQHRVAAQLLPLVETALAGEGTASVDATTNSLVLTGEPRAIAAALELLVVQDRPRRAVTLEAWSEHRSELAAAGYRVDWSPGGEAPRLGRLRSAAAPGRQRSAGEVLGADAPVPRASFRKPAHAEFTTTLQIREGAPGRIASGRVVPFVTRGEGGATTAIIETRSGLLARPHVLDDEHVQLDLVPFDGSAEDEGAASFVSASTRVVVAPGEIVVVGGVPRRARESESEHSGAGVRAARDEALLLLRVQLE